MATVSKRCQDKEVSHCSVISYGSKQNLWQKLCQMLCGNSPTLENLPDKQQNGVTTYDYNNMSGEQCAGFHAKEKYNSGDGQEYDLQNQQPERSNGSLGVGFERMDFKKPVNPGSSDLDAKTKASSSLKPGQSLQNNQETSNGRLADKTWEHPVRNKINSPEQLVHKYSSQDINKNGKSKDPDSPEVKNRSFEPQSEGQRKEGLKQENNGESQTKKVGTTEQAVLPARNEKQKEVVKQPSFNNKDKIYIDPSPPETKKGSVCQEVVRQPSFNQDDRYKDTSIPKTNISSVVKRVVRQTSFKDNNYADTSSPKTNKSSIVQQVVRQSSFKDDKCADISPPITTKSSVAQQVIRQTSFKDDKFADNSPPITTKSSIVQQVLRQTNFTGENYANASPPVTTTSGDVQKVVRQTSFKDDKYKDTSLPTTTKSSFPQNIVRQTSFNNDDSYTSTSIGQKVVRQASFGKDDKYTDTNKPQKTSKSSVGHTLMEQRKSVPKQELSSVNQVNTRLSSSMFTNLSSLGHGGNSLPPKSIAKPDGINKDDYKNTGISNAGINKSIGQESKEQQKGVQSQGNICEIHRDTRPDPAKITISGSGQQAAIIPLLNQGIQKQEDNNTKDKFGFSYSLQLED